MDLRTHDDGGGEKAGPASELVTAAGEPLVPP